MVKRIGSTAWRVTVSDDTNIFSIGVRTEVGREYEVMLGTVDSTPLLSDLLAEMARLHRDRPPRQFGPGAGPFHPRSQPLQPLHIAAERQGERTVLVLDFGGTVLRVEVDPGDLKRRLEALGDA